MQQMNRSWMLLTGVAGGLTLMLGIFLVWLNIERTDLAYGLKNKQNEVQKLEDHVAKLRVERDNLIALYRLERLAPKYDLKVPAAGQVRRAGNENGQE